MIARLLRELMGGQFPPASTAARLVSATPPPARRGADGAFSSVLVPFKTVTHVPERL